MYFYQARYYDGALGRFIQADSIVPDFTDPQALNRYSYVLNNSLKYTDPSGHAHYNPGDPSYSTHPKVCYSYSYPQTETNEVPNPVQSSFSSNHLPAVTRTYPDSIFPTSASHTFSFPWWAKYTGRGRTVPLVTLLDEDIWVARVKWSYGARIEVDGTGPLRIQYDRVKIGPTTIEASGKVDTALISFSLFDGTHVGQFKVVCYSEDDTLGIGIRGEAKTIAPLTADYSAQVSQRQELDFELHPNRTAFALVVVGASYLAPELGQRLKEAPFVQ